MSHTKRVRGVSVFRPIIYGNTTVLLADEEKGESDHTHRWTVAVRSAASPMQPQRAEKDMIGGADDLSYYIKKVTFKLHETYPTPLRSIEKPPFEVTEAGWGEFDIIIKIFFVAEAAEKPITFNHHLKLHPWPVDAIPPVPATGSPDAIPPPPPEPPALVLSPVHSWQYEEVVFSEPTETFYGILLSAPPSPLPKSNRHPKTLAYALGGGGNFGEFSQEMEAEEGSRLDEAKRKALSEIEDLRKKLISHEKEVQAVRKEVEELTAAAAAAAA